MKIGLSHPNKAKGDAKKSEKGEYGSHLNTLKGTNTTMNRQRYNKERRQSIFTKFNPFNMQYLSKYQNFFYGHCYSCNNFGHKAVDCQAYARINYGRPEILRTPMNSYLRNKSKGKYENGISRGSSFAPLC